MFDLNVDNLEARRFPTEYEEKQIIRTFIGLLGIIHYPYSTMKRQYPALVHISPEPSEEVGFPAGHEVCGKSGSSIPIGSS